MFILYFIKFSQLEFVLQVHINFFMLVLFYSFCSNLFIFFNLKKWWEKIKITKDSKRKKIELEFWSWSKCDKIFQKICRCERETQYCLLDQVIEQKGKPTFWLCNVEAVYPTLSHKDSLRRKKMRSQ
jgi:hypothetical protein